MIDVILYVAEYCPFGVDPTIVGGYDFTLVIQTSSTMAGTLSGYFTFWWTGLQTNIPLPANPMMPTSATTANDCVNVSLQVLYTLRMA